MSTVPTFQRRQTLDTGRGSAPNLRQDGRVGRALQGLGNSLAGAGAALDSRYLQQQEELERFNTLKSEADFISGENEQFRTATESLEPGAPNFAATNLQAFDARAGEFLKSVPERLRPQFEVRVARTREQVANRLARTESAERSRYFRAETKDRLDDLTRDIQEQPDALDGIIASGTEFINSTGLKPAEKQALTKAWEELARKEQFKTRVRRDPELRGRILTEQQGSGSFVDKTIGVESGGRNDAKNPRSTATGQGQFIESTWLRMIKEYRPELAAGKTRAQILALRTNGPLSREMVARYADENAKYLNDRGFLPSDGHLYLSHFAGPAGAVGLLSASRETPVVKVLGQKKINANPFLKGKTVGWTIDWANRKMGGKSADSAIPENFGAEDADEIRSLAASVERGEQAQIKRQQTERNDAVNLGIVTGQITDEQTILSDPVLDDGQKAARLNQLRGIQDDLEQAQAGINAIRSGVELNPLDSRSRSLVDRGFSQLLEAEDQSVDSEYGRQLAEETARRTGIVPRSYATAIRGGLLSDDEGQVLKALQNAQRIVGVSGRGLAGQDGQGQITDAAAWFEHAVNKLGLTDNEAAARFIRNKSSEFRRTRTQMKDELTEFKKTLSVDDLRGELDQESMVFSARLGQNLQQERAIFGEFVELAEDAFLTNGGDAEAAKAIAIKRMQRTYGVTRFGGQDAFLMRLPIEKTYPAVNGNHDYVAKQAAEAIKEFSGAEIAEKDIIVLPRHDTEAALKGGLLPPYQLMWFDENGSPQQLPVDRGFIADPDQARGEVVQGLRERRQDQLTSRDAILQGTQKRFGLEDRPEGFPQVPDLPEQVEQPEQPRTDPVRARRERRRGSR